MNSSARVAVSGAVAASVTLASIIAGTILGGKYMGTRLGGGLLGFFVLSPIANAIAFPFHGPGAIAAMQQIREVDAAMREPPIATLQVGSGASPAQRFNAGVQERRNDRGQNVTPIRASVDGAQRA